MNGYEKRTQKKKEQILEAAFQLMNTEAGIDQLTIDEVADTANVGKTSIFKYFGTKEQLIQSVFKYYLEQIAQKARDIMLEERPFEETLIAVTQNKIENLDRIHKRFYLDMMAYFTKPNDAGLSSLMKQYSEENISFMLDLFHRGRKEGKVDLKYSDEFLLLYFQALVEGISNPLVYQKIVPYTALWTEMLVKGIAPKPKSL